METSNIGSANAGTAFFLFGIFCTYRAQTTGRNAWISFFLGLLFAPIAGFVLLYENSQDRRYPTR